MATYRNQAHVRSCEERGIYNHNGDGLFYFKPTHWRPLPDDRPGLKAKG